MGSGRLQAWVGGIGGNRAHWLPLTNTAHSKPVRTLLVEVTSPMKCLKLPSIFLPFFRACSQGSCRFHRGLQGHWSGSHAMCRAGHLAQGWRPRITQGGTGWRGNSSSQTPEEDGLGEALKCHHSVVWRKSHPYWKVSYYELKHRITTCLRRPHMVSSSRKGTAAGRMPSGADFYVPALQT